MLLSDIDGLGSRKIGGQMLSESSDRLEEETNVTQTKKKKKSNPLAAQSGEHVQGLLQTDIQFVSSKINASNPLAQIDYYMYLEWSILKSPNFESCSASCA